MKHGYDFTIPDSEFNDPYHDHQLFEGFELTSLPKENIRINNVGQRVEEGVFHFNHELYEKCPDNVDLFGYFQTEKYFSDVREDILKDFTFKESILSEAKEFIKTLDSDEVISLHIRRGDYVNQPWHGCCPLSYYEEAISMLNDKLPIIIFTDDPKWALNNPLFGDDRFIVSEGNGPYHDLYLMTQCSDFIISNSTFSWWGAWLADKGKVVAPEAWFGPNNSHKSTRDLYPEHWTIIPQS